MTRLEAAIRRRWFQRYVVVFTKNQSGAVFADNVLDWRLEGSYVRLWVDFDGEVDQWWYMDPTEVRVGKGEL
jgi:hypothetical protein